MGEPLDLLVIGGGINGAGIARDAAGRGLRVLLVEQDDLASATSGYSSKLIHGGLRYLEQYEFGLVREALQEREVLLRLAPHIIRPLLFVLPHDVSMRPAWMIRIGLWMYDHLGGRITLPGSTGVKFPHVEYSAGLKGDFRSGFLYSDCRVDDARLTLVNALSAKWKGATIRTRTRLVTAKRVGGVWEAEIEDAVTGAKESIRARGLVNAAGPWVAQVLDRILDDRITAKVRLVKGSHIVVPKVHSQGHAYILQNADDRVVFVIPYENKFSLIGTTDVAVDDVSEAREISTKETRYLLDAVNRFLAKPLVESDIVWSYAGVRPLYDDGSANPSEVTRDYVLKVDEEGGTAPLLSIFGGKITTYRCLAEEAVDKLARFYPGIKGRWTATEPLPGGNVSHFNSFRDEMRAKYAELPREWVEAIVRRHGANTPVLLGSARKAEDLGKHFGAGLTQREVEYLRAEEWARTAEDVLWRRTKCGLHMDSAQRASVEAFLR
ncbi:glycerol-3-phosphate dehydrogenase [Usitatibacter palustris]|uniref:Glycerol-3-phosphate dehydrogenase n=1 Tax=Usitatibacter palustris TaxID=2732487 RepID=A0A6M4H8M2_9PROT|nr:glycerol-3-phosphate dehydrogenase [Usitatibacter palustris]QJR16069.1 D-erythritol 1-phosphate dehydrogenase [Usitatibacter palustris]